MLQAYNKVRYTEIILGEIFEFRFQVDAYSSGYCNQIVRSSYYGEMAKYILSTIILMVDSKYNTYWSPHDNYFC